MTVGDKVRDPKSMRGIETTAPTGGLLRGAFIKQGDTWGIVYQALDLAEVGNILFKCDKILLPKSTGTGNANAVGDILYLNTTTKVVSSTQGAGDIRVGICLKTALFTASTVLAYFDSAMAEARVIPITIAMVDISTAKSFFATAPCAGKIIKIYTIINGAIATADGALTFEINGTAITGSAITVANSGSASGDQDSSDPSALNVVALGDKIEAITSGAPTNTVQCDITLLLQVG